MTLPQLPPILHAALTLDKHELFAHLAAKLLHAPDPEAALPLSLTEHAIRIRNIEAEWGARDFLASAINAQRLAHWQQLMASYSIVEAALAVGEVIPSHAFPVVQKSPRKILSIAGFPRAIV